jgi:hypothetical protein
VTEKWSGKDYSLDRTFRGQQELVKTEEVRFLTSLNTFGGPHGRMIRDDKLKQMITPISSYWPSRAPSGDYVNASITLAAQYSFLSKARINVIMDLSPSDAEVSGSEMLSLPPLAKILDPTCTLTRNQSFMVGAKTCLRNDQSLNDWCKSLRLASFWTCFQAAHDGAKDRPHHFDEFLNTDSPPIFSSACRRHLPGSVFAPSDALGTLRIALR